jgi:peptidoglycan L-alanyl-D-glutamate endopeptidase CwlK
MEGREMKPLDARTVKNIATLDPKARLIFQGFAQEAKIIAEELGCDYVGISGHRTWEEQDRLFTQRPRVTNAAGGQSNHNFGIAMDFGVFQGRVYLDDANPALASKVHCAVGAIANRHGLEWGGHWAKFKDEPHFEIETGLSLKQKRNVYQKRGSVL